MNLATWLPQAHPVRLNQNTLHLEISQGKDTAKSILEKPEHRTIIEQALTTITQNCTAFQLDFTQPINTPSEPAPETGLPIGEMVNQQEGQKALEDPNLSKLVDTFKGRIVDIQHHTTPDTP